MRNKALLVGINYKGTTNALAGCANDVLDLEAILQQNGFAPKDIIKMSDDIPDALYPDKSGILAQLNKLVDEATNGDTIIFQYSGHGSQTPDSQISPDEEDGLDELICPISRSKKIETIEDDELKRIFNKLITKKNQGMKINCLFIADCCHSGTIVDDAECVTVITGCKDPQTSADAFLSGKRRGAMTASLIDWIDKHSFAQLLGTCFGTVRSAVVSLLGEIHQFLSRNGFVQRPNIYFMGEYIKSTDQAAPSQPAPVQPTPVQPTPIYTQPEPVEPIYQPAPPPHYYHPWANFWGGWNNWNGWNYPSFGWGYGREMQPAPVVHH